jgi:hypothetical protein
MSPAAQYASVVTLTFAVLGFQTVAFAALAVTAALLLAGFVTIAPRARGGEEEPEAKSPEEALREEAKRSRREAIDPEGESGRVDG